MATEKLQTVSVRLRDNSITQRFRAGIRVTLNEAEVDVTAEQLEALKADPYMVVREIGEKKAEEPVSTGEPEAEKPAEEPTGDTKSDNQDDEEPATTKYTVKGLLRKNLDEVRNIASESGVNFTEEATKKQLAEAIVAKQ